MRRDNEIFCATLSRIETAAPAFCARGSNSFFGFVVLDLSKLIAAINTADDFKYLKQLGIFERNSSDSEIFISHLVFTSRLSARKTEDSVLMRIQFATRDDRFYATAWMDLMACA